MDDQLQNEPPGFVPGDEVQCISDPSRIGTIVEICEVHAAVQWYRVNFGGGSRPKMAEPDLRPFIPSNKPIDNLINNRIDGYREFQRLITLQRLVRDSPLRNNIYAFNASRTRFFPYQFKPLVKLLDSPKHRLLIADEVGLGKTIEAGLILTELRARQTIQRVLIVCPASLTGKWAIELKTRFAEDFRCLSSREFLEFLSDYEKAPHDSNLNGIVSYESIRKKTVIDQLEALSPHFDIVIADEAHWMRNFGRKQRMAGTLLGEGADAMLLLTATPIHLSNDNLYSLLNLMDDEEFPDRYTAGKRFNDNEPIVKAQICMGQIPPNIDEAVELVEKSGINSHIKMNPLYNEIKSDLDALKSEVNSSSQDRALILKVQKDLSEFNLIGHIFSRTKKREVQSNFPTRRAHSIDLIFTDLERDFYNAVTKYVRLNSESMGYAPGIRQWILNTPQRRMASSIPAMVDYYRSHFGLTEKDLSEDMDQEEETDSEEVIDTATLEGARERLRKILVQWPENGPDTKYEKFVSILSEVKAREKTLKVMVFAFFKDTLRYLRKRLSEDGFNCDIISGDVPPEERSKVVDNFKTDIDFEILLSSRVGSEGLDFQFSNILFNYDLPWNPMEIEQRIGRLDRIGQASSVIRIYNFWIEGTIEQRILQRLYSRIGVFEKSIGELEMILGDELKTIERDILSKSLTPDEEERLLEEKARIVDRRVDELKRLESDAAKFIGTDQFFDSEIQMVQKKRRYVTGEQMRRFIVDFLKSHCPRTRLEYDRDTQRGELLPDDRFRTFLNTHGVSTEVMRYLAAERHGVPITFDAQAAFDDPSIDFINVLHPITRAITNRHIQDEGLKSNAHFVILDSEKLEEGFYLYFIYKLKINAARGKNILEMIILNDDMKEACNSDDAEEILGEMVEKGREPQRANIDVDFNWIQLASQKATKIFLSRQQSTRMSIQRSNNSFVERRLESLRTSYTKKIRAKQDQLDKAVDQQRQERYIRMLKGTIRRLETELSAEEQKLQKLRTIQVEYDDIAAGVLRITKARDPGAKTK